MNVDSTEITPHILKISFSKSSDDSDKPDTSLEFDIGNQGRFFALIETVLDQNNHNIVVDMHTIGYIDSSGLWSLFEGHRKAQNQGRSFVIYGINPDVRRVLSITQLDSKFTIVDTEADAIKAIGDI